MTSSTIARGLPPEKVHAIWVTGPGSYGRNDAGDAAMDAAFLSKAVGKPVRVQGMRADGTAWDPKGPASVMRARTRVYRALLWLYPSRFRREYGASMTQLYTDLERGRCNPFRRALAELAITVPYQYWEAFMSTTPSTRGGVSTTIFRALQDNHGSFRGHLEALNLRNPVPIHLSEPGTR